MDAIALATTPHRRATVSCHICSSIRHETYLEARGYRLVRCNDCGLWYVNPQPAVEELVRFYSTYDDGNQWRNREEHFNRKVRDAVLRFKRRGAVLDVGSGSGNFLRCMRTAGFTVFGIEPSRTGSGYTRSTHGIEMFCGMVEDYLATNPDRTFDVVTLLNVIEHLTQPRETVLQLRRLLSPGGLLVAVVPDARFHALLGEIRGWLGASDRYWLEQPKSFLSGFKFPDHLCSFQPRTISLLLQRCGFTIKSIGNAPVVFNPQPYRNVGKLLVRSIFSALYHLTGGRVLFGYSTLLVAQKQSDDEVSPVRP
jgi:SAM-dependent methyltransferase